MDVTHGRDVATAEDSPVEPGERDPVTGNQVDMAESGVDHGAMVACGASRM